MRKIDLTTLGDSLLRVQQAIQGEQGIAVEMWQIRNPGMWAEPVRVHLTGAADFAWGVITMKGLSSYEHPNGMPHTAKGPAVRSVGQNAIAGPNFFWATMEEAVIPGSGVSVLGSKADLDSSTKVFSILRKTTTEYWTAFSYSQTERAPLAAGGVGVSFVVPPVPPNPGDDEGRGRGVLGWIHP
jgi:hypothetical protein